MSASPEEIVFGVGKPIQFHGNSSTMNLSSLVYKNCVESHYWRNELSKVTSPNDIIDHIGTYVKHLEAWERGKNNYSSRMYSGVRGISQGGLISSAFCIMVKLHEFKITMSDLYEMAKYRKNPYVQGLAFLYARHVLPPNEIYKFFRHFLTMDGKKIVVTSDGSVSMTLSEICEQLLLENKWYGQILPRIPVPLLKEFKENIEDLRKNERTEKHSSADKSSHSSRDRDRYERNERYGRDHHSRDSSRRHRSRSPRRY